MQNDHDISVLNGLIETTLDSVKGFSDAAEDSNAGTHAAFFPEMAQERRGGATRLQAVVAGLGGRGEYAGVRFRVRGPASAARRNRRADGIGAV